MATAPETDRIVDDVNISNKFYAYINKTISRVPSTMYTLETNHSELITCIELCLVGEEKLALGRIAPTFFQTAFKVSPREIE